MPKDTKRLDISLLESQVVLTINNIGWHAYLWFPVVQREILNFGLNDSDEKVHAAIVGLVKKGALMVTKAYLGCDPEWSPAPGVLEAALDLEFVMDDSFPKPARSREQEEIARSRDGEDIRLSYLESQIVLAIEHVGWYAHLWFPIVYREVLNFGSHAPDEDVHAAWVSLVRKGALVCKQEKWGHIPEWDLAPGVLKTAVFIGLGGRKIERSGGRADEDCPPYSSRR